MGYFIVFLSQQGHGVTRYKKKGGKEKLVKCILQRLKEKLFKVEKVSSLFNCKKYAKARFDSP